MIQPHIFHRIKALHDKIKDRIPRGDILAALIEELGEYSRAKRIEDKTPTSHRKTLTESSKIEIIDLMLVSVEAYLDSGGSFEELTEIADRKLDKWESLWAEALQ